MTAPTLPTPTQDPGIERLTGSSAPTGAPPSFEPIATSGDVVHEPEPSTIDPAFAAIDAHRAAHEAFGALCARQDARHSESRSEKAERKAADSAETNAFVKLATTEPQTLPGLLAFSAHLSSYLAGNEPPQESQAAAMASIAAASQKLLHREIASAAAAASISATSPLKDQVGYAILRRPRMRSGKERLAELVGEYERLLRFDFAAGNASEDDTASEEARESGKISEGHAGRMISEIELMIEGIAASDIDDLGLKARILSWTAKDLWEDRGHQGHGVRDLVDDILMLAGMDRIRSRDFQLAELLPGYTGPERHIAPPAAVEPTTSPSGNERVQPSTELERLARDYAAAAEQIVAFDVVGHGSVIRSRFERLYDEAYERLTSIEASASYIEAVTVKDAVFQTKLAFETVGALYSWVNPAEDSTGSISAHTLFQRVQRLLFSVRGVLERIGGASAAEVGGNYAMAIQANPFRSDRMERHLEEARALTRDTAGDQVAA